MAYVNSTRAASATSGDRLSGIVETIRTAIERRRLYNRTFRELAALTDRELNDLGISRMSIAEIAREAAYGK